MLQQDNPKTENGLKNQQFCELNLEAFKKSQNLFDQNRSKMTKDKAPQFLDLNFQKKTLNSIDRQKFQLLQKNPPDKKSKNVKNFQMYKQDLGWKRQTKSSKKILCYHIFIQSLSEQNKGKCSRSKIDTPTSLLKSLQEENQLQIAIKKAQQPFQRCMYLRYLEAKQIIKQNKLFNDYCFQILSYMHYIRLYIIWLLEQKLANLRQEKNKNQDDQKISQGQQMICQVNYLQNLQDEYENFLKQTSDKDSLVFGALKNREQNNFDFHQNVKESKRKNCQQSIFLDELQSQQYPQINMDNLTVEDFLNLV